MIKSLNIKRYLPQTLFGRSLLIIVTPVLLLQILIAVFFFDRHWNAMTVRLAQSLAGEISLIMENIEGPGSLTAKDYAFLNSFTPALGLTVLYDAGAEIEPMVVKKDFSLNEIDTLAVELEKKINYPFRITVDREEKQYDVALQLPSGVLHIYFIERRLYSSTSYIFILWLLGGSFILFAVAIIFMRNQIRPIRKLAMAADRFGRGIDIPKFKPQGAREVRQAAEAFYDMRVRIQRQVEQRTAMLSGVSHDLRTPITRMKLQLEFLEDNNDTRAMKADLNEMEAMIEGYLNFIRGDNDERHNAVNIETLIKDLINKLQRQGLVITMKDISSDIILRVKRQSLERALSNIIVNACKYGESAEVSLRQTEDFIFIDVNDNGPGIDMNLQQEVFKPFYRIEGSRNSETGGIGLGLAVAQDIIHSHGGVITLRNRDSGGLSVGIRLPRR